MDCLHSLFQKPTTIKRMPQSALSLSYVSICQLQLEKKDKNSPKDMVTEDNTDSMQML